MRIAQEKVRLFHEKYGYATADTPRLIENMFAAIRFGLMFEELDEYADAQAEGNITKVADALGDLLYTVLGTAVMHGIDLSPVFDEIHRSNMTKDLAASENPDKPLKGPTFEEPRIADILLAQTLKLEEIR